MSVSSFVSLPTCCRGIRGYQHLFVNSRYVKSRTMMAALEEAYANQKIVSKLSGCVLRLTTRLNTMDINVRPTRQEVKFGNDKKVFDMVYHVVRSTLEADHTRPSPRVRSLRPAERGWPAEAPLRSAGPAYRGMTLEEFCRTAERSAAPLPFHNPTAPQTIGAAPTSPVGNDVSGASISIPQPAGAATHIRPAETAPVPARSSVSAPPTSTASHAWTDNRARPAESAPVSGAPISTVRPIGAGAYICPAEAAPAQPAGTASAPPSEEEPWRMMGEALSTYIIVEQGDKALFIDKHAAHERLSFGRVKTEGCQPMIQILLEPVVFTSPAEEGATPLAQLPPLGRLGFKTEDFGGEALIVRVAPSDATVEGIPDVLPELAGRLLIDGSVDLGAAQDALLHTMVCKVAIKGNRRDSPAELLKVTQAVISGAVKYCPHGRSVAIEPVRQQLERRFGRA